APDRLAGVVKAAVAKAEGVSLELGVISNRGMKVWPDPNPVTFLSDHWRLRFQPKKGAVTSPAEVVALQRALVEVGFDIIKTENLYNFDGIRGFSLDQGA